MPSCKKNLLVVDIDDTILAASKDQIAIIKKTPEGEIRLSSEEFAKDSDNKDESKFSFREFRDADKIYNSIVNGKPLIHNLVEMDKYINDGYKLSILTARSKESVVLDAVEKFLMYRDKNGELRNIKDKLLREASACVNDERWNKYGENASEKKAYVIKQLAKKFDNIVFIDDSELNLHEIEKLKIKKVKLIKAK
jgi:hypothetical protein